MGFELFIAMRYLRAKRKMAVISVITALSVLGIAAGVMSLVVALAINNGFRQDLQGRLLGATAHVNLQRKDGGGIAEYREFLAELSRTPGVIATAPALYGVVLASNGNRSSQMVLKGVDAQEELKVGNLLAQVRDGSIQPLNDPASPAAPPPVVIGKVMAQTLGAKAGDSILLTSPQGPLTPFGMVPRYRYFRVVGIFDSGFYDFDSNWAFTSLSAAQQLLSLSDVVSVLEFKIADIYQAPQIASQLQQEAGAEFGSTHWMEQNRALFSALRLEKTVTVITIGLIVFVAALNILISLIMMVMEKYRDIAVLVSMGARQDQIRRIFQLQGILIGTAGTALGLVGGYLFAWLGSRHHLLRLDPDIYSISYVPFQARVVDGVWVAAVALLISFLATLYPARNATRIAPAEALRYE
ncbi:MAG: permease [Acidobacteria bacterium RIFCSPLOWO2_02_FULL_60_20]|nr:MAG: permease [Acidobacteria bacterium RIFCSPLOWO2_02_FULL_60_20]